MRGKSNVPFRWGKVMGILALMGLAGCEVQSPEQLGIIERTADPEQGKRLVSVYGCVSCHQIAGVSGEPGSIGPPLTNWKTRSYIAGALPNEPQMLIHWILNPHEVEPGTAMPDLGISKKEAIDIAAYLYSQ